MDVTRRRFLQVVGLAGLALPTSSFAKLERFDKNDPRFKLLKAFRDNSDISFKCDSVDDYLFFTKYCVNKFDVLTFDDPYKRRLGVIVYFKELKDREFSESYFDGKHIKRRKGKELTFDEQPVKLITVDMSIVDAWIKENNIDDNEFRKLAFMPAFSKKTVNRLKATQSGFYESHDDSVAKDINTTESNVKLADMEMNRHEGESYIYKNRKDKEAKTGKEA